jgi:Methyltransferase domain
MVTRCLPSIVRDRAGLRQAISRYLPDSIADAPATKRATRTISRAAARAARVKSAGDGHAFASGWRAVPDEDVRHAPAGAATAANPLEKFFDARRDGRGIFKWRHYFEIYHRHLAKFAGRDAALLEIGIAGGGSLDMWQQFLGPGSDLYGVDIDPECRRPDDVTVFIGDQADRVFWQRFRAEAPPLDIVIDDGGHRPEQQRVTLEELLPYLRPGGIYICEDVHGDDNPFLAYVHGLSRGLFAYDLRLDVTDPERHMASPATPFQSSTYAVHLYPYVVVVERHEQPGADFVAAKHGTEWPGP